MTQPLIAIVGDISPQRVLDPPLVDAAKAQAAAEQLGAELARRRTRLLVYGGPFLEAHVVRGYVAANPTHEFTKGGDISWWWRDLRNDPRFASLLHR